MSNSKDDADPDKLLASFRRDQIMFLWEDALEWAKRGDVKPFAALLRGDKTMPDHIGIRTFLADALQGKWKRSRGRQIRKPEYRLHRDTKGRLSVIDATKPQKPLHYRKWVGDNISTLGDGVYEAAAKHFNVHETSIRNAFRRSAKAWTPRSL